MVHASERVGSVDARARRAAGGTLDTVAVRGISECPGTALPRADQVTADPKAHRASHASGVAAA